MLRDASLWIVLHTTLVGLCLVHAWVTSGKRRAMAAFAWCAIVAAIGEAWGLSRGLFGARYHYVEANWPLPRAESLPLAVPAVWFGIGYVAHVVTSVLWFRETTSERSSSPRSILLFAAIASALMTAWDVVMDPIAIELGLWQWDGGTPLFFGVPWENTASWFLGGTVLQAGLCVLLSRRETEVHTSLPRRSASFAILPLIAWVAVGAWYAAMARDGVVARLTLTIFVPTVLAALWRFDESSLAPSSARSTAVPVIRRPAFDEPRGERYWAKGSAFRTHYFDALNIAVLYGEGYMIRNLRTALAEIRSPALRDQVIGFMGQEAEHAKQHRRFLSLVEAPFHRSVYVWCRALDAALTRGLSLRWNLALSAGIEHLTAVVAKIVLSRRLLEGADPAGRALFEWHMAEELEHRCVVFDAASALGVGYLQRACGFFLALVVLGGIVCAMTVRFVIADGVFFRARTWLDLTALFYTQEALGLRMLLPALGFLRPGFHPADLEVSELETVAESLASFRYSN